MAGDIKLPGMKKPANKYLVFGLGGVALYVGYEWYKGRQSSSTSSSTSGTANPNDPFPWDGTVGNPEDPYSQDPNTGITYGDEGQSAGNFGLGGGGGGGGGGTTGSPTGGPPFSSNSAWDQWVIQTMTANDPQLNINDLTAALGLYLAGQQVDATQKTMILEAEGLGGPPPVPGPNNYPPNVHLNGGKGGGGNAVNPVTGLKQVAGSDSTGADISWDASQNATSYTVKSTAGNPSMTGATMARIHSIAPHAKSATVTVLANPAAAGAKPASVTVNVKG